MPTMTSDTPATMFFIPMAISLAYGVLFATVITLVLVPALYVIVDDLFGWDRVAQGDTSADALPEEPDGETAAEPVVTMR